MIRVISSPSSSTTGFATLILAMVFSGSLHGRAAYGSAMATASTAAPNAAKASTSEAFGGDDSRPASRAGRTSRNSPPASSEQPTMAAPRPAYFEPSQTTNIPTATQASTIRYGSQASPPTAVASPSAARDGRRRVAR